MSIHTYTHRAIERRVARTVELLAKRVSKQARQNGRTFHIYLEFAPPTFD